MNNHSARKPKGKNVPRSDLERKGAGRGTSAKETEKGKRERILDAAVRVFAAEGFYKAKVSQIAAAAGVADGTIYLYFKNKDDLLIQLFEDRMEQVNSTLRAALASETSAAERLRRVVKLHLELIQQNPHMGEVITVELRQSAKFIKEYANPKFGEFLRLIAGAIVAGQANGELRSDLDPYIMARALFGALDEIALAWLVKTGGSGSKEDKMDLPRAAVQLGNLFVDGLRAPTMK
jgi:TetR/AcrR family transcriptional regulator, fatty acid metabolism regulator protein